MVWTLKSIDTLIPDIEKLFDGHIIGGDNLAIFGKELTGNMSRRFEEYGGERRRTLRLSNIGKPLRQLWFDIKGDGPREPLPPEAKFKFLYGDILEAFVVMLAQEAGHEVSRMQEEVRVDGVVGHIDGVIDGWLVDAKSCSTHSFAKFKSGSVLQDDPFGYVGQLAGYARALGLPAAWVAIDKVTGHLCLMKLPQERIDEYDVEARIVTCRETLSRDEPPSEKCYPDVPKGVSKTAPFGNGNRGLGTGCSYCPHKRTCWKDANDGAGLRTFLYSTGPEFLTYVAPGKEPRVFEVKNDDDDQRQQQRAEEAPLGS